MKNSEHMARGMINWKKHTPKRLGGEAALLDVEQRTFDEVLPSLLASSLGKFVVITDQRLLGISEDFSEALKIGYAKCGPEKPFLVEKVEPKEVARRNVQGLFSRVECIT